MNSVHDMGGMDGMGPIEPEPNEPVFHHPWEGRVFALLMSGIGWGRSFRFGLESIPADEYLRLSYYERWFTVLVDRVISNNQVTPAELENGRADPSSPGAAEAEAATPESEAIDETEVPEGPGPEVAASPRFRPQQQVRARNLHPPGHIRLPRYTRGKRGTIVRDHGVFRPQDTDTSGRRLSDQRQYVYTVRFTAGELWGDRATEGDSVYVDLWEGYLEPA